MYFLSNFVVSIFPENMRTISTSRLFQKANLKYLKLIIFKTYHIYIVLLLDGVSELFCGKYLHLV